VPLSPLLDRYDQLILDLDGCIWVGDRPVDGSVEAVAALRQAGKRVAFATNDPRSSTEDYVAKLWSLGIQASLGDVVTVGGATQHLLAETRSGRTAFVIGTEPLWRHVAEAGLRLLNGTDLASRAEVVVVAGPRTSSTTTFATPPSPSAAAPTSSPRPAIPPTRSRTGSGRGPARSWRPWRWRAAGPPRSWGSRSRSCSSRPSTGSARAARWWSAIGWTRT
jgi:hypothetical protein